MILQTNNDLNLDQKRHYENSVPICLTFILLFAAFFSISSCTSTPHQSEVYKYKKKKELSPVQIILKNDCLHCHSIEDKVVGPSYLEISRRYANHPNIKSTLIDKIKKGGGGLWYGGVMSAHPLISDEELDKVVEWILSLDNKRMWSTQNTESTTYQQLDILGNFSIKILKLNNRLSSYSKIELKKFSETFKKSNSINFKGEKSFYGLKKNEVLHISRGVKINQSGKYFLKVQKTGIGKVMLDGKNIITSSKNDHETIVDFEEKTYFLEVFYQYVNKNDTLSLHWLTPDDNYYSLIQ